jgi:hypothetical protein
MRGLTRSLIDPTFSPAGRSLEGFLATMQDMRDLL